MVTAISVPSPPARLTRHHPVPGLSRHSLVLQYLDMSDCPSVDDTSVKMAVENCPQLVYLFLRRCYNVSGIYLGTEVSGVYLGTEEVSAGLGPSDKTVSSLSVSPES